MGIGDWFSDAWDGVKGAAATVVGGMYGGPGGAAAANALVNGGGGGGGGENVGSTQQGLSDEAVAADLRETYRKEKYGERGWGGANGIADQDVGLYRGQAGRYADLRAPDMDYSRGLGYQGMGDQARGLGMGARTSQGDALGLMRSAAMGNAPSQAQIMMKQGNDQAIANQLSMAAGARGPAAMAMAQQQAMGNASAMQTNNMNNMGALRAQEMANARAAYMGGAGQMRQGDDAMRALDLAYAQRNDQNAQYGGQLGLGYRQLGMQGQLGYDKLGWDTRNAQMGSMNHAADMDEKHWEAQAGVDTRSREDNEGMWKWGVDTGAKLLSSGMSGATATGGGK